MDVRCPEPEDPAGFENVVGLGSKAPGIRYVLDDMACPDEIKEILRQLDVFKATGVSGMTLCLCFLQRLGVHVDPVGLDFVSAHAPEPIENVTVGAADVQHFYLFSPRQ